MHLARLESVVGFAPLALIATQIWMESETIRKHLHRAKKTGISTQSDDDYLKQDKLLGPDFPLLEYVRRHYEPGTKIALMAPRNRRRTQRFWLAFLPEYPISEDADVVVYALDQEISGADQVYHSAMYAVAHRNGDLKVRKRRK